MSEVRQRLPAARRRSQLLEVALERFAADGFHRTSMEEIAEAAGVTKPVLYQHFGSKRTLYLELLETVGQELLDEVADGAAAEDDPYQRVLAGFRAYFRFVCERTSAFQLLFGSGARLTDEFADARPSPWRTSVAATIAAFIDADIDAAHRELLGYAIVGLGEVAGRWWVALRPEPARLRPAPDRPGTPSCWRSGWPIWSGPACGACPAEVRRRPVSGAQRPRLPPNCDLTLGMTCIDKSQPGVTVWEMAAGEHLANPVGVVQGGLLAAFADSAMATATVTNLQGRRAYTANTELKISFLRARRSASPVDLHRPGHRRRPAGDLRRGRDH